MAGPGGGPPRRSHTKSRKGCETCKRRHIRCDENFPQCRNCTKHSVRCPYMDMPATEERAVTPERPDLLWTPEIEAQIQLWQQTGEFPFPGLYIFPAPSPQFFSAEDLRLIHHVASISMELGMHDVGNFTIWTSQIPLFIKIGATNRFVMHALLALSATHIAWLTDCPLVKQVAYQHRGIALKGLHEAIGLFSRENSDAVLAASLLLSWQASEWRGWTQLMHGTSSVIDAMQPWEKESQFGDFIAEQSTFPTAPPSPAPNARKLSHPRQADMDALQHAYGQLHHVEAALTSMNEDTKAIRELKNFVRSIRKASSSQTPAQRFEMLTPLRTWLFWLPVMYLQQARDNPYALVVLAYYYTIALVVEPIFPEVGAAYFGSLSLQPIEEIARRLFSINVSQNSAGLQTPLALMEYPIDMVSMFRERMGWKQPQRTASFPTFQQSNSFVMSDMQASETFSYGSQPFEYRPEHMSPYGSEPPSSMSPLSLDPFGGQTQFLNVPTPSPTFVSGYQTPGYQSPAYQTSSYQSPGSSYGEMAYSDQGGDEYMYEVKYEPQTLPASAFGGISNHSSVKMPSPALRPPQFPLRSTPQSPLSQAPQDYHYEHPLQLGHPQPQLYQQRSHSSHALGQLSKGKGRDLSG